MRFLHEVIGSSFFKNPKHCMRKFLDKHITNTILSLLFLYLSTAYFSLALPNIVIIVLMLVFTVYAFMGKKQIFSRKNYRYWWLLAIPVLIVFSMVFHSSDFSFFLSKLLQKSPTLLIPLATLAFINSKASLKKYAGVFIYLSLLALAISSYHLLVLYREKPVLERWIFEKSTIIQHLYFGIYQLVALVFLFEFYRKSIPKYAFYLLFTALSLGVIISTSRIAYILYILVLGLYMFRYFSSRKALIFSVLLLIAGVGVVSGIPQLRQKFTKSFDPKTSPRLIIWKNTLLVLQKAEHPLWGTGLDYYQKGGKDVYWLKGLAEAENYNGIEGFNSHNQYLEFVLLSGIIGLFFLFFMLFTLYKALQTRDVMYISFALILSLFSMVENVLDRQWGIILFSVLISLLYSRFSQNETVT